MFNNFLQYEYQPYHKIYIHDKYNNGIYLGDVSAALDLQFIKNEPIKVVVTAALGMDQVSYNQKQVKHIIYPLLDAKTQNIQKFFNHFYQLIQKQIQNNNILVHCAAGISRSATLVISYFMKKNNWTFKQAVKFVRDKRPIVLPNLGFQRQLKQYQVALQRQTSHTSQFDRRNVLQTNQLRKVNININISPFKTDGLPNIKNFGQTSWLKSKVLDKPVNIKFDNQPYNQTVYQKKLQVKPRKSQHESKGLKKKAIHVGNFAREGIYAKLQSGNTKMLERTNNFININAMNVINQSNAFNDNFLQNYSTPTNSHHKKLSSLSHRSQKKSRDQQLRLRRNYSNNKTNKQANHFQQMNKVVANKLMLNERKITTQKNLRIRGLYRLAQLDK